MTQFISEMNTKELPTTTQNVNITFGCRIG
ncbi:hypothetical protein AT52_01883 [Streptococcus equi subsp. zooepidemicus Sz35]|nr:hypothetical protein Q426_08735 [Streptococcus equi subsp. zooepidemicus CY]KIS21463.1 hypothetical protein AT52_01883 [Streptococcus equi subsp. zooepidemicus Sz35]